MNRLSNDMNAIRRFRDWKPVFGLSSSCFTPYGATQDAIVWQGKDNIA
jgi:hypothetical protein